MNRVLAQTVTATTTSPSPTNATISTTSTSSSSTINLELYKRMAEIEYSNKPQDIATLAYIWGFPLVAVERGINFATSPNAPPGPGQGPVNSIHCVREIANRVILGARPSADTPYCFAYFDLNKEPVVIVVPPINESSRYYSFAFFDAYNTPFAYVGTRATGSTGGTYLLAGPEWNGQVPEGMTKIWSPTNVAYLMNRIIVKGPSDLPNVHAIQDKIIVKPLSVFLGRNASVPPTITTTNTTQANASSSSSTSPYLTSSKQTIPISPQTSLIPSTGIKIFDEIGAAMVGNPPNPPDPALVSKLASIGIGPGKTPSKDAAAANETIKAALQTGITEGQKLIDEKVANLGITNNGWLVWQAGIYGTDYLLRAASAVVGTGGNIPQEAYYPTTFTDSEGKPLLGANKYVIHFNRGELPPVNAFWSITMYNSDNGTLVDNPINRYSIGKYTEGLKNNTDGSLDIYVQHANPGKDKESNWLPAPQGKFDLIMRLYLPQPQVFNGTWQYPTVQQQQMQPIVVVGNSSSSSSISSNR